MGLLERISAARSEQRFSVDQWLNDYLIPSFSYNGAFYSAGSSGLVQTLAGNRASEISSTLPGYTAAVRQTPPAFAAQMVRALVLSQARFRFRNRPSSATPKRMFGTTALNILERPWPNGTTGELVSRMEWHAGLAGNAFVAYQSARGPRPERLRVLRPDWCALVYGSDQEPEDAASALDGDLIGLVYQNGGMGSGNRPQTLLVGEFAHWAPMPDPLNAGIGMSWITPAVREIQGDQLATQHKIKFFENGATPNLVVKGITGPAGQSLTKGQFDELVDMMEGKHRGLANAYRTLYLTAGADATVIGSDLHQIDFKATQGAGETRIAVLSRVPAPLLGISEGLAGSSLNAGNFGMARRIFADTWVYPNLQDLAASLSPIIKVPGDAELWFDTSDMPVLREDAKDAAEITLTQMQAIESGIRAGHVPDTVRDAVGTNDLSKLQHTGMFSVQMVPPGAERPGPTPATPPAVRDFDPAEPRDPNGKWSKIGAAVGAVKDALNLAGRIQLGNGEHLAGSGRLDSDSYTGLDVVWAAIDSPRGREIRLGTVFDVDADKWRAANKGATASLSSDEVGRLRGDLADAESKAKTLADEAEAIYSSGDTPSDPVLRGDKAVAKGRIDSSWGPVLWTVWLDDSEPTSYQTSFKVGADESADGVQLDAAELGGLINVLDRLSSPATRAVTSHRGNAEQLRRYWTRGKGLAKWAKSPHPWTTLYGHLVKFMPPEEAKRMAAEWFHDVFHFWPGSDMNRVTHGKPPRGKKIGPG